MRTKISDQSWRGLFEQPVAGLVLVFVTAGILVAQAPTEGGAPQDSEPGKTPVQPADPSPQPPKNPAEPPAQPRKNPDEPVVAGSEDAELDRAMAELKTEFPDLRSVVVRRQEFLSRLWKLAETSEGAPDPTRLARLELIAASALESVGRSADARKLWVKAATSAAPASVRAKAFFDIGMHYFLRQRYTDAWKNYWRHLPTIAPDSEWTRRTERFAPFLELVFRGTVPEFEGTFGDLGSVTSDDLRGKWVILQFWSTTAPGSFYSGERMNAIKARLSGSGHEVTILGINVDTDTAAFAKALIDWEFDFDRRDGQGTRRVPLFDWPQHHDGLGFESPIVRRFGIPRAPMEILLGPEGELLHVPDLGRKGPDGKRPKGLRQTLMDSLARQD